MTTEQNYVGKDRHANTSVRTARIDYSPLIFKRKLSISVRFRLRPHDPGTPKDAPQFLQVAMTETYYVKVTADYSDYEMERVRQINESKS